jgi:hypothetical protein
VRAKPVKSDIDDSTLTQDLIEFLGGKLACRPFDSSKKADEMLAEKTTDWLIRLDRVNTSLLLLATLAGLGLLAGILYRIGLIGLVLRLVGLLVRDSIRRGFRLWERLLSWAGWGAFLAIVASFIVAGWLGGGLVPGLRVVCGTIPLFMGAITCLAYMYIDLERYEVERGHMAIHNPLMATGFVYRC